MWIKISKISRDYEIFEIFEKLVQNWPIYKNARNSANFEDIGVWFFANIFFFIVELNCKIKIVDKLKTKENIFFRKGGYPLLRAGQGGPLKKCRKILGIKVHQFTTLLCRKGLRSIR